MDEPSWHLVIRETLDWQEKRIDQLERDLSAARAMVLNLAERLTAASECLGRVAEKKDKRNQ